MRCPHFDLALGINSMRDGEGHELCILEAAEVNVMRTAGELALDYLRMGTPADITVE